VVKGITRYHYAGYYAPFSSRQNVNVVDIDLNSKQYKIILADVREKDSLSSVCKRYTNAITAINAGYLVVQHEPEYTFIKINDSIYSRVEAQPSDIYYWKHKGCFYFDNDLQEIGITYGNEKRYETMKYDNIISSAPVLIYNGKPKGTSFVNPHVALDSLPYENPNRHQGTRFPRTAIALTSNKHLLLMVVDGKNKMAAGMTASEITRFLAGHFSVESALNMDGGGSSTLWMKGYPFNGIVNYPTDNRQYDHYGQRKIKTALLILPSNINK
jgi:exopolysaccharide biosynthesis protein